MDVNIWLKGKVALFIGGDPKKGQAPVVTINLDSPQILVDKDGSSITILETNSTNVIKL